MIGRLYGLLEVDSRQPREFNEADTNFLRGHANLLAGAVAPLRLLEEARFREAVLRESEDHYRAAIEHNPQIPWSADPQGNIIRADERWTKLTDLNADEALGGGLDAITLS
jgi:PAS domain-containing protein